MPSKRGSDTFNGDSTVISAVTCWTCIGAYVGAAIRTDVRFRVNSRASSIEYISLFIYDTYTSQST